ncbi:hypothetical protein MPSEU_000264700 [Mayamaea pseudoterrestris]|nr:hypothetical protein MPSEU_000264700 [Mayamaea pseudoterrestris]
MTLTRISLACLCLLLFATLSWSAEIAATESTLRKLSDADCRTHGFDPWQLACSTCDLLESYVTTKDVHSDTAIATCRQCCQVYKDAAATTRMEKPFEAAVLVYSRRSSSAPQDDELGQFLSQDWDKLVELKNNDKAVRLHKKERINDIPKPNADNFDIYQMIMQMQMQPQAQLFLFQSALPPKTSVLSALLENEESLKARATQVISLDHTWKRDDIRDMLTTLLP